MSETIYKILLVEDDSLDQMAFRRMIEREKLPYDYTIAGSFSDARKALESKEFDVVISDYSLGDGTAMDVLALAKETPVILVTGAGDEETAIKVWHAGVCDYLTKDIERNYLKTISITIEKTIRQHELKVALDRKQKNLHAIFDATPVGMMLADENLVIMRVNEAVKTFIGKEYLDIIGQLPGNVLNCANVTGVEHKQCGTSVGCNLCMLRRTVKQVFSSGQAVHGAELQLNLRLGNAETTPWFRVSVEPVNIDGKKCAVVAMDDITARKQAEGEVKRLSSFPRLNPNPILEISDFGTVTYYNAAATATLEQLGLGNNFRVFLPADMSDVLKELKQGHSSHIYREVEIKGVAFGEVIHFVREFNTIRIYASDISMHKAAEKKLQETMELKAQFISTVSHELRTPLTCIKEAVEAVLEGVAGQINDRQRHFLDIVKRNMERLGNLINDVLDFQRLESGKSKLDLSESDVRDVIKSVEETMAIIAKQKGLNFAVELDVNLPKVWFDSNKIIQVLTNLVSNAIKFTPQGGSVTVSMLRQGDELVMRVRDTGMGIPKESLPKICDRFYRVPRPGKEIKGTGLGLSIVRKIVDLHRGRMEIESEVDKETTFTIFLPLDARAPREVLPEQADKALEASLSDNSVK